MAFLVQFKKVGILILVGVISAAGVSCGKSNETDASGSSAVTAVTPEKPMDITHEAFQQAFIGEMVKVGKSVQFEHQQNYFPDTKFVGLTFTSAELGEGRTVMTSANSVGVLVGLAVNFDGLQPQNESLPLLYAVACAVNPSISRAENTQVVTEMLAQLEQSSAEEEEIERRVGDRLFTLHKIHEARTFEVKQF